MSPGGGLFSAPGCPGSIVGAAAFHFRVRDENGWVHRALTTKGKSIAHVRQMSNCFSSCFSLVECIGITIALSLHVAVTHVLP